MEQTKNVTYVKDVNNIINKHHLMTSCMYLGPYTPTLENRCSLPAHVSIRKT